MALPPTQFPSPSQTGKIATTLNFATSLTAILTTGTLTKPSKSTSPSPMTSQPFLSTSYSTIFFALSDSTTCKAFSKAALLSSGDDACGGEVAGGDIIGGSGGGASGEIKTPTEEIKIELTLITRQSRNPSRNVRSPGDNVDDGGGNSEADDVVADLKLKWFFLLAALLKNHFIEIKTFAGVLKVIAADSLIFFASIFIRVLIRVIERFLRKRSKKLQFVTIIIVSMGQSYLTRVCLRKRSNTLKRLSDVRDNSDPSFIKTPSHASSSSCPCLAIA
ncbi:hypothetical protein Fot_50386 [Forsythia ovata]|uniref:Uncharacterized protein n=1 Tax=Forsythia ovata TaxID=205694 RepID=A0ABD1PY07_9LAMI